MNIIVKQYKVDSLKLVSSLPSKVMMFFHQKSSFYWFCWIYDLLHSFIFAFIIGIEYCHKLLVHAAEEIGSASNYNIIQFGVNMSLLPIYCRFFFVFYFKVHLNKVKSERIQPKQHPFFFGFILMVITIMLGIFRRIRT